jgi:pantoate kinase
LAKAAVFLGFKEIQGAINQSIDGANGQIEVGKLLSKLRETPRSSSLDQYLERLTEKPFPIEEFVKAVDFAREAGMKNDVEKKIDALDGDHKSNWDKLNKNDTVKAAMERLRA